MHKGGEDCCVWLWPLGFVIREGGYNARILNYYHYIFKCLILKYKNGRIKNNGRKPQESTSLLSLKETSRRTRVFWKQNGLPSKMWNSQLMKLFKYMLIGYCLRTHTDRIHFEWSYFRLVKALVWHKNTQHILFVKILNTKRCLIIKSPLSPSFLFPSSVFR